MAPPARSTTVPELDPVPCARRDGVASNTSAANRDRHTRLRFNTDSLQSCRTCKRCATIVGARVPVNRNLGSKRHKSGTNQLYGAGNPAPWILAPQITGIRGCSRAILLRMRSSILGWVASGVLLLTLPTGASRQEPPSQERGAYLLTVDFSALAREGLTIQDLSAKEVSIRVGGRHRPVRSLQLIETARSGPIDTGLPLPFG